MRLQWGLRRGTESRCSQTTNKAGAKDGQRLPPSLQMQASKQRACSEAGSEAESDGRRGRSSTRPHAHKHAKRRGGVREVLTAAIMHGCTGVPTPRRRPQPATRLSTQGEDKAPREGGGLGRGGGKARGVTSQLSTEQLSRRSSNGSESSCNNTAHTSHAQAGPAIAL